MRIAWTRRKKEEYNKRDIWWEQPLWLITGREKSGSAKHGMEWDGMGMELGTISNTADGLFFFDDGCFLVHAAACIAYNPLTA